MVDWFRRRKAGPPDDVGRAAHVGAEAAEELVDRTSEPADGFSEAGIREALRDVRDPEIGRDLVSLNMVRSIDIAGSHVTVGVSLTTAGCPLKHRITTDIRDRLKMIEGIEEVEVDFGV
ncbi:MAG TPA: iron-sulfur cluster assembly protein, partial [Rubrobacter sp.]|nr:iron-sulfur cluster assembly protein [Rubrobacter sp.]